MRESEKRRGGGKETRNMQKRERMTGVSDVDLDGRKDGSIDPTIYVHLGCTGGGGWGMVRHEITLT